MIVTLGDIVGWQARRKEKTVNASRRAIFMEIIIR
jgi:hypothetical protein